MSRDKCDHSEHAAGLVERYAQVLDHCGLRVATGVFGAHMSVDLVNDGPVTIILEHPGSDIAK